MEVGKGLLKRSVQPTRQVSRTSSSETNSDFDEKTETLKTETSVSLDSNRNQYKRDKDKKTENVWGSLVNVMYGLENEKIMKLSPEHFG